MTDEMWVFIIIMAFLALVIGAASPWCDDLIEKFMHRDYKE